MEILIEKRRFILDIKKGENKFYVGEDEAEPRAEIHYITESDALLTVDHTYVSEALRGRGIGEKLVKEMVDFARQEGKKINPDCPFAKKQIEQHEAYRDVLADGA